MVILLPKTTSLQDLETSLTWENWKEWMRQLKSQSVSLKIPQFRIERRYDLRNPLKTLGVNLIFTPEADFSGMTGQKGLFVNKAVNKTTIRIDEKGTEATSATGVILKPTAVQESQPPYEFTADHPFLFIIWDKKTESILFIGRLAQP